MNPVLFVFLGPWLKGFYKPRAHCSLGGEREQKRLDTYAHRRTLLQWAVKAVHTSWSKETQGQAQSAVRKVTLQENTSAMG